MTRRWAVMERLLTKAIVVVVVVVPVFSNRRHRDRDKSERRNGG